jgi:deoxycytidine triphosphate deaminase
MNNDNEKEIKDEDIKIEVQQGKFDHLKKQQTDIEENKEVVEKNIKESLDKSNKADKTENDLITPPPKFKVPATLWKTFVCSLALFIVGSTLIGIGFIHSVAAADPGKGITFWTIGSIVLIPGAFYTYKFWRAKRSKSEDARQEIYDQIPEL